MVTLQGEKKRWNGTKPWCLNDLVSSFNPCAPCSLESLWSFPRFYPKVASNNMISSPSTEMMNGFYNFCSDQTLLASMSARHGELMFLHQWVSATSAFEDLGRLNSPHEWVARHGELCSRWAHHGAWEASGNLNFLPQLALKSPLSSPWRVDLCISSRFLASTVSRRAFSYKELALDVKSIIKWFFSIYELFTG